MIVTLTANPSLDRTVDLGAPLTPGGVHRIRSDRVQPGGKGINVATGVHFAGIETLAVLPAGPADPLVELLGRASVPVRTSPVAHPVRTNLTVLSAPDVTTKINEPGGRIADDELRALFRLLEESVGTGDTVMLSGSLAPGFPDDTYVQLVRSLRQQGAWVGVDTSDVPLGAIAAALDGVAPDFLKPNAEELGQIVGADGTALEAEAERGELDGIREAALDLHHRGVGAVLVTLGGAGAVLAADGGAWFSSAPPTTVVSTVGAGDSATAGFLVAREQGEDPTGQLARAVAYGSCAVTLPGTTIPRPEDVSTDKGAVRAL